MALTEDNGEDFMALLKQMAKAQTLKVRTQQEPLAAEQEPERHTLAVSLDGFGEAFSWVAPQRQGKGRGRNNPMDTETILSWDQPRQAPGKRAFHVGHFRSWPRAKIRTEFGGPSRRLVAGRTWSRRPASIGKYGTVSTRSCTDRPHGSRRACSTCPPTRKRHEDGPRLHVNNNPLVRKNDLLDLSREIREKFQDIDRRLNDLHSEMCRAAAGGQSSAMPSRLDLVIPTLQALVTLGGAGDVSQIEAAVPEIIALPAAVVNVPHGGEKSKKTELEWRMAWARTYLKKAGLALNPKRGKWEITAEGRQAMKGD